MSGEHKITNFGFDWDDVSVERCFSHKGYKCIRVRHMKSGKFIDVQVSPSGRNIFAYTVKGGLKGFGPSDKKVVALGVTHD